MKFYGLAAVVLLIGASGCTGRDAAASASNEAARAPLTAVTIASANGRHVFQVEMADTVAKQQRGLMYRTDIPQDGGMLFAPYPPEGGGPREASFWMKNTVISLDLLFIRTDGTVESIAANAVPYSLDPISSGEPVAAVLEIAAGRAAELGIKPGDTVTWRDKR